MRIHFSCVIFFYKYIQTTQGNERILPPTSYELLIVKQNWFFRN